MKERPTPITSDVISPNAVPGGHYHFSPKAVVIAGPPAAGKSHAARLLVDDFGYTLISLDLIVPRVAAKHGGDVESTRDPKTYNDFKNEFLHILRDSKFKNIVIEGCRMSFGHIYDAFMSSIYDLYSPFTIAQAFYLNPPREIRKQRFLLRQIRYSKMRIKGDTSAHIAKELSKVFWEKHEPVLPDFAVIEDTDTIAAWATENAHTAHPGVPEQDREVFKTIAEADSFNPFYQTIEYRGRCLVPGFTQSPKAWENIMRLNVDFKGKSLCDYGCMHGYYTFKAEEAGATGFGVDMDRGAIDLSNYLAEVKRSQCHFQVYDITTPLKQKYDIILALNVLHRTGKFELTTEIMFDHCNECILEVGESQLPFIESQGVLQGFKIKTNIPSHRVQSCIGPRRVLHMVRG